MQALVRATDRCRKRWTDRKTDGQTDVRRYNADSETNSRRAQATASERRSRDQMMDGRRIITTAARETNARSPQTQLGNYFDADGCPLLSPRQSCERKTTVPGAAAEAERRPLPRAH